MHFALFLENKAYNYFVMTYMFTFALLASIIPTFLGGLFTKFLIKQNKEISSFFQNFAIGGIFSLIFLELIQEAIEHFSNATSNLALGCFCTLLTILITGFFFFVLHELLHKLSHHHDHDKFDEEECEDHAHSKEIFQNNSLLLASFIFLIAIFAHNIPEGLALGSLFNSSNNIPIEGIIMSCILFIHNFLIGYTMTNSFIKSQKSFKFSLLMTTISSLPAYLLAIVGYFVSSLNLNEIFNGIVYAISTGSLIYVLFIELLPQGLKEYKSKYSFIYILLGIFICGSLIYLHF